MKLKTWKASVTLRKLDKKMKRYSIVAKFISFDNGSAEKKSNTGLLLAYSQIQARVDNEKQMLHLLHDTVPNSILTMEWLIFKLQAKKAQLGVKMIIFYFNGFLFIFYLEVNQ